MGILEANLDALKGRNPALAARIASHPGDGVRVEPARLRGRTFEYGGRRFISGYDPIREAEMQAEEVLSKSPDSVVLFGLGCGYLVSGITERKSKAKVIVHEPSLDILKGVLSSVDLSRILGLEKVFISADVDGLVALVREVVEGIDGLVGYQTVPYKLTFPAELKEFQRKVRNAHMTNRVGIMTEVQSNDMWLENYFSNIEAMVKFPPVDSLRGRFKGVPMIIAGAGPSLAKNARLLREAKGKAVIIAAVTAYKPLLKHGVIPDFVIAAEKVDLPEYFTYGEEDRRARFILGEVSHPNMFRRDVKGIYIHYNPFVWPSRAQAALWGASHMPVSGGSVTTSAFDMGVMLDCDPIIMIGQDLSFGTKRSYSEGGVYISQEIRIEDKLGKVFIDEEYMKPDMTVARQSSDFDLYWLKGLDGRPIPSKYDWVTFHQWFEKRAAELKREDSSRRLINATEGGARVEGMEHITLREALDRHVGEDHPIEEVLLGVETSRKKVDLRELARSLDKMRSSLMEVNRLADDIAGEAARMKEALAKEGVQPWFAKTVKKLRRLEDRLFKSADGARFIWDLVSLQTWRLKMNMREEAAGDSMERFKVELERLYANYRGIGLKSSRFIPLIEGAIDIARALKEASPCCGACSGECGDGHH